jgi:mannose-6-phosphate isomerase-like protein (cupin superfamily)
MQHKQGQPMAEFKAKSDASGMAGYKVGDGESRDWGSYVVTAVGLNDADEEFCEKDITVKPAQALSLQSHDHRREHWRVKEGVLTVVLDGQRVDLRAGEDIKIPLGGIHCMANLSGAPCVVHEIQEGLCREEDIHRFKDMYGRAVETSQATNVIASLKIYDAILTEIGAGPSSKPAAKPPKL